MAPFRFKATRLNWQVGDSIRLVRADDSAKLYELVGRKPGGYNFKAKDGEERFLSDDEISLRRARGNGELEHYPVTETGISLELHRNLTRAFSIHPPAIQLVAEIKAAYCRRVSELLEKEVHVDECFRRAAEEVHAESEAEWRREFLRLKSMKEALARQRALLPDGMRKERNVGESYANPVKPSTIETWYRLWVHCDEDIRALVPLFENRGDHRPKKLVLYATMMHHIEEFYFKPEQATLAAVYRNMCDDKDFKKLKETISYTAFNNFLKRTYSSFLIAAKRQGLTRAKLRHDVYRRLRHDTKSMEEIEVDHCLIDVIVVDERSGRILGRPWLTVAICRGTRMVVGCHLSFEVPSWASLQRCLAHAFWPKNLSGLGLNNPWPCEGIPKKVITDNGKEFKSRSMRQAELALGFTVVNLPGRSPWLKGIVERFFGTMQMQVLSFVEGKTFGDTKKRDDYNSTKKARIKLSELKSKLLRWIVDDYHVRFHEGLRGFPINEWQKRMPEDGVDAVPRFESIREFLGAAHLKPIGKKGVALYGHYYFHPELKQIRRDRGPKQRYEIRSDPYDIGAIELLTPDGQWLRVWSDRPELTVGVSMHQSEVHNRLAKKLAPKGEAVTDAHRLEALERAQAESEEIMNDGKGKTTVRNVARYHHDNGVFMTPVAGQSGGRAANDDNLAVPGVVDVGDVVAVTDDRPKAASRTASERRAKVAKVAADEAVGADEFAAYQAQRKAAMRRAS